MDGKEMKKKYDEGTGRWPTSVIGCGFESVTVEMAVKIGKQTLANADRVEVFVAPMPFCQL